MTSIDNWNRVEVPERVAARAYGRVIKRTDGCWISTYSTASHGYAQIGWQDGGERHVVLAHRASWAHVRGQVPTGMSLDHTCKVRACVNPDHLRLLTNEDNARRINGQDWPLGQCRNGHPDSERIPITRRSKNGARRTGMTCGPCTRDARARWVAKNSEVLPAVQARYNAKRRAA